jgi:hypothetical protein
VADRRLSQQSGTGAWAVNPSRRSTIGDDDPVSNDHLIGTTDNDPVAALEHVDAPPGSITESPCGEHFTPWESVIPVDSHRYGGLDRSREGAWA